MAIGVGFGPGGSFNNSWTAAAAIYQYIGYPTGNLNLAGARPVTIESVSVNGLSGGSPELQTSGNLYITRTSSQINFSRYTSSGTLYEVSPNGPWAGSFGGAYYWSTVPTAPQSISAPSFNQGTLTLTNTFTGSASDGGQGITSYSAQYINTAEGKTITNVSRSGTTAVITVASHGYSVGNVIQVYGLVSRVEGASNDTQLNGQWTITAVATNTITFSTSSSGTITSHAVTAGLVGVYGAWTGTKAVSSPFTFSAIPGRHYQMRVYANNARGSSQARTSTTIFALPNPPIWGTKTLNTSLTQARPYSDFLNIAGYTLSAPVTATGSLPSGLSLTTTQVDSNNATVTISGTVSNSATVGSYSFTLTATNVGGSTTSNTYTLNVASSSTVWLSPGKGTLTNTDNTAYALRNGVAYNPSGVSGIVSSGDYLYAIGAVNNGYSHSGSLPAGITATNTTGTVNGATVNIYRFSGTPTVSGTFNIIVSVNVGSTITQAVSFNVRPTGKRYPTGSSNTPLTVIKRYDASAGWVDVTVGKRYDGTNWVELGNPS